MEEHNLLVRVRVDEFVFEIAVKFLANVRGGFGGFCEDGLEVEDRDALVRRILRGALLGEAFGCDNVGGREGGSPGGEEDVVLHVGGSDVAYIAAELRECVLDGGCEGDGGEDCEVAGGEFDCWLLDNGAGKGEGGIGMGREEGGRTNRASAADFN